MKTRPFFLTLILSLLLTACGGVLDPVLPTPGSPAPEAAVQGTASPRPTVTMPPTAIPRPASTGTPTDGPTPTSIIGPTRTPLPDADTPTPRPNPNAPRIEYFTADLAYVYPGDPLTVYWSVRGADRAAIYRLDDSGQRSQLWNVEPSGSLVVQTARDDRGFAEFLLTVDNGDYHTETLLSVPLLCPYAWFFAPEPANCPDAEAVESTHIEQIFEGGRMIYVEAEDLVYVLFTDGLEPAWTAFQNRYEAGETADEEPNFIPPPGRFQPTRILGLVWRGSDPVRNRLALGLSPETVYEGAIQADDEPGAATVYLRSADGSVLQLDPEGAGWTSLTP